MGLMDFIKKQFIDVIEMPEIDSSILVKKFPMQDQEIQYGGQLIVRESQMAIFVNEGKLADVFGPGTYKLTTQNIPLLTNLKNWDKLFESPFKSDVYFLNTKLQMNSGWGTSQAITIRDKDFGMVRVRSFGQYTYKISDPSNFFKNVSGAMNNYTREELENQLRTIVVSGFTNFLGQSGIPFIDMAANQTQLASLVKQNLLEKFSNYGLEITDFIINNLNLPEELQKTLDQKISMGMVGDLNQYMKFQMANSIPLAASNEGGIAGIGAGLGVGMNMANMMQQAFNPNQQTSTQQNTIQNQEEEIESKLIKAKSLLDKGLITTEEYQKLKSDLLSRF